MLGEGNGTPLQYSCLEDSMDGGAWWVTVHGVAKSRTRMTRLSSSSSSNLVSVASQVAPWKNPPANAVQSLGREDPWRRKWQPTPVFLLGHPIDRGAWWATVHGAAESDTTDHARCIVPCVLVISCHASASFGVCAGRESGIHGFSRHDTSFISVPNLLLSLSHTHIHTPYLQLTQSLRSLQHVPRLILCDCQKSALLDGP